MTVPLAARGRQSFAALFAELGRLASQRAATNANAPQWSGAFFTELRAFAIVVAAGVTLQDTRIAGNALRFTPSGKPGLARGLGALVLYFGEQRKVESLERRDFEGSFLLKEHPDVVIPAFRGNESS